jgi:competence protein ComEC
MHPSYYRRPLFLALVIFALFIGFFRRNPKPPCGDISLLSPRKKAVIEAVVAEYPRERNGRTSVVVSVRRFGAMRAHGRILAEIAPDADARWGATVRITGELSTPFASSVPGNLDWQQYLAGRGVFAQVKAETVVELTRPPLPLRIAGAVKNHIAATYRKAFAPEEAAILSGLTLGDKSLITPQLNKPFMDSGTVHLLVASGTKVGFVAALAYMLCALLRIKRRLHCGIVVLAVTGFYLLIEGCDPPLVRSYVMCFCALAGYAAQRDSGAFQGLVIAALLVLGLDNQALFKADFQLSFAATFAIILVFSQFSLPAKWPRWIKACIECAIMTVAAQIALFPVSVPLFHRYSISGMFANIPMIPLSGVLLTLGFCCAALSAIKFSLLLKPLAALTGILTLLFWKMAIFFSSFKWSAVSFPDLGGGTLVACACAAFTLLHLPSPRMLWKVAIPAAAVALISLVAQHHYAKPGRIWAFREGKSACLLLRTLRGNALLIDAGIDGGRLCRAIMYSGSLTVDSVFISSLEDSSWQGLDALAGQTHIGAVYIPYGPLPKEFEATLVRLEHDGTQVERLWPGESVTGADWSARAVTGLHSAKDGHYWSETGYSGIAGQDSMSFEIASGPLNAQTGAYAAFARLSGAGIAGQFDIISRRAKPAEAAFTEGQIVIQPV